MPVAAGGRYRMKQMGGKMIRLHFTKGGTVNEAKNMATGAMHTPSEFKRDKKRHGRTLLSR